MISVNSLSKSYGRVVAAKDVSFNIGRDEIVAFVGPNGAGKSTVLKVLSTYLKPDSGSATINGLDVVKNPLAVRMNIGYMPENSIAYESMRVDRFLKFVGESRRLSGTALKKQFEWVVENCHIENVLHKQVGQCSKGYQRRVSLAMSIIHDPDVLLLDEPTHGLDPLQVMGLRDFLVKLKKNKTILFSSHIFQEVVAICDRVLVINNSQLLADGTLTELAVKTGRKPSYSGTAIIDGAKLTNIINSINGTEIVHLTDNASGAVAFEIVSADTDFRTKFLSRLETAECGEKSIEMRPMNLEEIFADIIRETRGEVA